MAAPIVGESIIAFAWPGARSRQQLGARHLQAARRTRGGRRFLFRGVTALILHLAAAEAHEGL